MLFMPSQYEPNYYIQETPEGGGSLNKPRNAGKSTNAEYYEENDLIPRRPLNVLEGSEGHYQNPYID